MKKAILYLMLLCVCMSWAQGKEWHVRPLVDNYTNPPGSDGTSFEKAWCLQYALYGGGGLILPGDIVWLHGDRLENYTGTPILAYKGRFISTLTGTSDTVPIIVSSYPGEWAVIDGNTDTVQFIPEQYLPIRPCAENSQPIVEPEIEGNPTEDPSERMAYSGDEEDSNHIFTVNGTFATYRNFEVTCLGSINRILDPCNPNNGFEKLHGIEHNGTTSTNVSRCKLENLVIRNIPGSGIGSWKYAADSQIYGCIIYNNGYILRDIENCSSPGDFGIFGKGPGIYTQNATDHTRLIRNNFIINNYDSGVMVWSANTDPGFSYIRNYELSDNTLVNNGNPGRRHKVGSTDTGGDVKPNIVIDSDGPGDVNDPTNINVFRNVFYTNDRGSFVSGVRVKNSNNVTISDNYFFKGTTLGQFINNTKNLTFSNNFYLGKRVQVNTLPGDYGTNNWNFDNNTYYARTGDGTPSSYAATFEYHVTSFPNIRRMITQFRTDYPLPSEQNSSLFAAVNTVAFSKSALKGSFPVFNKIVQNTADPNKFYVTLNNPTLAASRNVIFSTVPNGKFYTIRDPQNYFTIVSSGTYNAATGITFPMNLTAFELPKGFADHCTEHSYAEIATFIVEFGCADTFYDIATTTNQTDSTTKNYRAKNNITFGPGYTADVTSVVDARAAKSIWLKPNSVIKSGSVFLGKIETTCNDIPYVGEAAGKQSATQNNVDASKNIREEAFVIYPNPNSGIFTVESKTAHLITRITIARIDTGKKVFDTGCRQLSVPVDISKETTGLYNVQVFFENNTVESKTIIKK